MFSKVKLTGSDGVERTMSDATKLWWDSVQLDNDKNTNLAMTYLPSIYKVEDGSNPNESCPKTTLDKTK